MSDETEEQKKLMRQIDISCVQAFHTMDEIDAMVELAKKYRLAAVFTLPAFSAHVAERLHGDESYGIQKPRILLCKRRTSGHPGAGAFGDF